MLGKFAIHNMEVKMETVSNYQMSLCKWTAEEGVRGIIKRQTLLKATKVGKYEKP